jgi:hypothetical protein
MSEVIAESPTHALSAELEEGLRHIREAPRAEGVLALIVRRPGPGRREVLDTCRLDVVDGLVGDCWSTGPSGQSADGWLHLSRQLTVMSSRVMALLARDQSRWALSGDQLFVDLDLSVANLPSGTRVAIGSAVIAVTEPLHSSCKAFASRYGVAATAFVHSPVGGALRLRGVNARVIRSGDVRVGDPVKKLSST